MENASKALIIAGGMLIGVIIATIFAYELMHMFRNEQVYNEEQAKIKIAQFNLEFERFRKRSEITAQDIITIVGYVQEWNDVATIDEKIEIKTNAGTLTRLRSYINKVNINKDDAKKRDSEFLTDNSEKYIIELEYRTETNGRIKTVTFKY